MWKWRKETVLPVTVSEKRIAHDDNFSKTKNAVKTGN